MGKYKHEGKGRNISVSGGQERKDLFKDMSGGYNAMGDSNTPNYKYNGSAFKQRYSAPMEKHGPLHGNAFGHAMQKAGGDYDKAKSMLEMKGSTSPTYKTGCTSGGSSKSPYKLMGDPKKKLKGKINKLSDKHKKLYDAYEQGSKVDMDKLGRIEDRLEKKEKNEKAKKLYSQAFNKLNKAYKKDKKNPDILNYMGYTSRKVGNFEEAEKFYLKGLDLKINKIAVNKKIKYL